ncbi:MAG TPA: GNAT family N-acetyltransferase [Streptosporangiaceae bacterium]
MTAYPIRPIGPDEFLPFCATAQQAFNMADPPTEAVRQEQGTFEFDRSLAAFDGQQIVGTACAYTFQMAVPGAVTGVAGVSFVAVLPTHRRRGILSSLMRRQLAELSEHGEPVAALFSSESGIYGRFGYGVAAENLAIRVLRGEGTLRPGATAEAAGVRLRLAEPADQRAALVKVYDMIQPSRPGMHGRDDRWWTAALDDPASGRGGASPLRCLLAEDDAGPRGYALYATRQAPWEDRIAAGTVEIRELHATDPAAAAALWGDLLTRDLTTEVRAWHRPVDEPLLELLADRRRARPQLSDGLWIRLVNVPAALTRRRYACPVDIVLEVTDDLLPGNAGRWRLRAGGHADQARPTCERTADEPALVLPVAALGACYLGGSRAGALVRAGLAAERQPGAAAALSAAMMWDPAPWSPTIF